MTNFAGEPDAVAGPSRKIVLATFGSLGDLHPFIALAKQLKVIGEDPVIATSELHRERIERQRIPFHPIRPDLLRIEEEPDLFRELMDRKTGTEKVLRELFLPHLRESFEDLVKITRGADLLVTHTLVFAGRLAAETSEIPWLSVILSPMVFVSKYDPPVPSQAPWLRHFRPLGAAFFGPVLGLAKRSVRSWCLPVEQFRKELALPPAGDPLFEGAYSPHGVLAMFSHVMGAPQRDWPGHVIQTGFPFFDDTDSTGLSGELESFLARGAPPIVFTLGSSAVMDAGRFYEESLGATTALRRRAVLLIGRDPRNQPKTPLPEGAIAVDYAPYSELFPRAAAIVHQGGVGTTAQALRAGKPMVVVPWGHDQPDNAERVRRLGVARTIDRYRYSAKTAAAVLRRLLHDPGYSTRAAEIGRKIGQEDGAAAACEAIRRILDGRGEHALSPGATSSVKAAGRSRT